MTFNMTVVADKEKTLAKSNEIVIKLMDIIAKDTIVNACVDDPAEYIYLMVHIASSINSMVVRILHGYGITYAIDNMSKDEIMKWINTATKEKIQMLGT